MNKKDFFKAAALKTEKLTIDGFGEVELHELTVGQRGKLADLAKDTTQVQQAKLIIMGCDMFDESDIESLCNISYSVTEKLTSKIMSLSGMGGDSDAKKD